MGAAVDVGSAALARALGDAKGDGPAYVRLSSRLRAAILDGLVPARALLPSERDLARALGVSRTTATAAYDVLRAEGYLESRRGSGTRASLPTGGVVDRELSPGGDVPDAPSIDLTVAALPAPGLMGAAVERGAHDLARYLGGAGYDPAGLPVLRHAVADRFAARGVPTRADEIVITSGAQHALTLLLHVLVARRDALLFESPSYPNAFEAARRAEARIVTVPMPDTAWDVERISSALVRSRPRVAFLMPDFQNPTGLLMDEAQRVAIAEGAGRTSTAVVADETFADLAHEPLPPLPPPMAAFDPRVITIGSMSKGYWGGLRIGWIRCSPPLAYRLARARTAIDLATPILDQLVAARLLEMRAEVLRERSGLVTARRDALTAALREELPRWSFTAPRGGLSLWVRLDRPSAAVAAAALAHGVRILPGSIFDVANRYTDRLRIPFSHPRAVLRDAVSRLRMAATDTA